MKFTFQVTAMVDVESFNKDDAYDDIANLLDEKINLSFYDTEIMFVKEL